MDDVKFAIKYIQKLTPYAIIAVIILVFNETSLLDIRYPIVISIIKGIVNAVNILPT
jgi:hypothetical protein